MTPKNRLLAWSSSWMAGIALITAFAFATNNQISNTSNDKTNASIPDKPVMKFDSPKFGK